MKNATQLKSEIRNLSIEKSINSQILLRQYMMERFLERLYKSKYKQNFILKGGLLISSIIGNELRSTMDIDTTVINKNISVEAVDHIIEEVVNIDLEDGVTFKIKSIYEIMDDHKYTGLRVSMSALFDSTVTPLKIDISTGDIITPNYIVYDFETMFDDKNLTILSYNIETIISEKIETLLTRSIENTRMRDFYDIYILYKLCNDKIDFVILNRALLNTLNNRDSIVVLGDIKTIITYIRSSEKMESMWRLYQQNYTYALLVSWSKVIDVLEQVLKELKLLV